MKKKLFSVGKNQLVWDFFRAGGSGGQNQNKRSSACRVTHPPSGAVGESREHREQRKNRVAALKRLAATKEFKNWCLIESCHLERKVDEQMAPENILIEFF